MRRDSIFYQLFVRQPTLLFELIPDPPENADAYRYDSVSVKETRFEMDGVFLPPKGSRGTVYFSEVQFQKDERLYERIFAEFSLYFYRNCEEFDDWQIVAIYPSRSIEQSRLHPHRSLLNGGQMHRIYLDELGDIRQLPLWVSLMVLTTVKEAQTRDEAVYLADRARREASFAESDVIISMIAAIVLSRFKQMNFQEVGKMLNLGTALKDTRAYQDVKQEAQISIFLRQLQKRFGDLPEDTVSSISALAPAVLDELGDALLDFESEADLQDWLRGKQV